MGKCVILVCRINFIAWLEPDDRKYDHCKLQMKYHKSYRAKQNKEEEENKFLRIRSLVTQDIDDYFQIRNTQMTSHDDFTIASKTLFNISNILISFAIFYRTTEQPK